MRAALSKIGAKASYLIERWKLGLMMMFAVALGGIVSALVIKVAMEIIGALLSRAYIGAWGNVLPVAAVLVLPFVLTSEAFLNLLADLVRTQREDSRAERQRR